MNNTYNDANTNMLSQDETSLTRVQARERIINQLSIRYPHYVVQAATREQGGGIVIIEPRLNKTLYVKFSTSRLYTTKQFFAWYSVNKDDALSDKFDLYCFSYFDGKMMKSFIFDANEFHRIIRDKVLEESGVYHFFLQQQGDHIIDIRDSTKANSKVLDNVKETDLTYYLEEWGIVERLLGKVTHQFKLLQPMYQGDMEKRIDEIMNSPQKIQFGFSDFGSPSDRLFMLIDHYPFEQWDIAEQLMIQVKSIILHIELAHGATFEKLGYMLEIVKSRFNPNVQIRLGVTQGNLTQNTITIVALK